MTNISTATRAELRETLRNMRAENLDVSTQLDLIHADIIGMNPVTFEHNGGNTDPDQVTTIRAGRLMVRCLAKNAAKTAAKLRSASRAPARMARRTVRTYPAFKPGMSTAQYINDFAHLNSGFDGVQLLPVDLSALMRPCALYENGALDFDAIEEPIDAPEATESPEMVAIVSELTGATMASIPREKAEELAAMIGTTVQAARQVSELIAIATTAAVIEQASEAAPMATLGEPVQPAVGRAAQNIDTTAQPVANQAESVQVNDATFESAGLKIYKRNVKSGDLVESRWIIQSPENAEREARGERQIGGDLIVGSREDAIKRSEQEAKRYADDKARKSEIDRKENEATAAEEARKAANRGKSIVERRADAALSKEVRDSETGTVMTRAQWVERRVNDGARPSIEMVDKIKPMSRTQFNRASNAEQRAHEAKIKAGGKVPEYSLGDYIVSKAEYDYAQKLIAESATKDQAQSVQVEPPPDECEPDPAPELATVDACSEPEASATTCDASSASNAPSAPQNGRVSSAQHQAPTKPTHDAHGQRIGQRVAGRSGHWCAVMFTDPDGRPSFEFDGPGGLIEALTFATGRERMAALQAMARQADQAAQDTDDQDDQQTEREHRLNAFDAMTATAADVQAMGAEYVAQLLDDLEDINYHTEGLILQALAAGREDLAARARSNLREHLAAGYLTDALRLDRQAISEALRQSTEPDPTHPAGDTPSSDPTSAQGYAPPAPDAHQQTAPVPNLADKVPRAVGADSGPASNPPGATAPSAPAPSAPAPSAPAPDTEASADEPEPEFTRAAPQPFDMLAMIAAGLAPADLVGLGIVYSGDRANPSGCGAITDVQPCSWYKYTVTVTLEDGRQSRLNPVSFTDHLGNRYRTNFKRHGAPYLAELSAARLAVEAADKAAKQAAADEKDRQRRELPQQWPQLKAYDPAGKLSGCTLAAANIRILLKEKFPGIKFSVKTSKFSGGDDINVSWTDGPAQKDVEAIADLFSAGSFDGMEDIYNYRRSVFTDLFGDSKYIFCNRDISPELLAQAIADEWPNPQGRPSVEDYQKARGAFDFIDQKGNRRRIEERLNRMGWNFKS